MLTPLAQVEAPQFFSAEHVHVLINHLPVIGLAMAILALVLALMHHSRKTEIIALILVFVAAASAWPVNLTGQSAYKNVHGIADDAGADWLQAHRDRADKSAPAFYVLALLAVAALIIPHKWPRTTRPLAFATLALSLLCEGAGGWIALAGGRIRHPEFRTEAVDSDKPHSPEHTDK